jgi:hypothetical protein
METIDKETAALLGLLEMLNEQSDFIMRQIESNIKSKEANFGIDKKYANLLNLCRRWRLSFTHAAEDAYNYIARTEQERTALFDPLRKAAMDFMVLNLVAYEYLTTDTALNTVLRQIQKRKTRRNSIRNSTIKKAIIK